MDLFQKCGQYKDPQIAMDKGIYPYFHALQSGQDTVVTMDNHRTIMLGSNNYLGLTSHPEVVEAGIRALEKYGSGCSGSRFLNGTLDLHLQLENALAKFLHKDDCITFGTGFQSNLGIISAIVGRSDYVICDRENHASIYDACRLSFGKMLRYQHNDMTDLEKQLQSVPDTSGSLIVTDGAFSMGGDICNLPEIVRLAKKYGARVMVDDAHGLGVLGKTGRGTAEYFGLESEVDILMGTFSKSLASLGGYLAASKEVVYYIKHTSRPFIFSASMTPANVACAAKALEILEREPNRPLELMALADYVRQGMRKRNIDYRDSFAPIIPINTYDDHKTFYLCKMLLANGIYVNPVVSPAVPKGEAIIRTSYTATHTRELMDEALDIMKRTMEELA